MPKPKPFLKWAGGKTQLLAQFQALYPPAHSVRRYVEPFVGSGAVFFQVRSLLHPGEVVLCDSNAELINVWTMVRDRVEGVIRALRDHQEAHSANARKHYYHVRERSTSRLGGPARAARFLYLNKTCYNGLYRVNSKGRFNVPLGRYARPAILHAPALRLVSEALTGIELRTGHFRDTVHDAGRGDFVYFDPPYHPLSPTSSFTSYTGNPFGVGDQEELAGVVTDLHHRGACVMLSNSDSPLIRRLYDAPGLSIRTVRARRSINSKGDRRGAVREVVVLNYDPAGRAQAYA